MTKECRQGRKLSLGGFIFDCLAAEAGRKVLDSGGDTVWLGVVDNQGNAASMIQSIYPEGGD